jgi:hypothetical protein
MASQNLASRSSGLGQGWYPKIEAYLSRVGKVGPQMWESAINLNRTVPTPAQAWPEDGPAGAEANKTKRANPMILKNFAELLMGQYLSSNSVNQRDEQVVCISGQLEE